MCKPLGVLVLLGGYWGLMGADPPNRQMPKYSETSIVSLASLEPGPLAPNSLVAIFGSDLAWVTRYRQDEDVAGDTLPVVLPGTGVTVLVNSLAAPVEMVSPEMVTFLMPSNMLPGPVQIQLVHSGRLGPTVRMELAAAAPAFYQWQQGQVLARHAEDYEWVTRDNPARAGETVLLYAGGLGATRPPLAFRRMPRAQAEIAMREEFSLLLDGEPVPDENIEYAGILPWFPGLYEIRVRLPEELGADPEITIVMGEIASSEGFELITREEEETEIPVEPEPDPEESNP